MSKMRSFSRGNSAEPLNWYRTLVYQIRIRGRWTVPGSAFIAATGKLSLLSDVSYVDSKASL